MAQRTGFLQGRGVILRIERPTLFTCGIFFAIAMPALLVAISSAPLELLPWRVESRHHDPSLPRRPREMPPFTFAIRLCDQYGYEQFQLQGISELGIQYADLSRAAGFTWSVIEPEKNIWRWPPTDEIFRAAESRSMMLIVTIMPEARGPGWTSPNDPNYAANFGRYAGEIVRRYRSSPAWSGIVVLQADSSDVYCRANNKEYTISPHLFTRVNNAAYDAIKNADPRAQVVSPGMRPDVDNRPSAWEDWHKQIFSRSLKFDWFGIDAYGPYPAETDPKRPHSGLLGLLRVREFLDRNGFADKPIFQTEAGHRWGDDVDGEPEEKHAELLVQTFIQALTMEQQIRLKGWIYYSYVSRDRLTWDSGLVNPCTGTESLDRRQSWFAAQTLFRQIQFPEYRLVSKISGAPNRSDPFLYLFEHRQAPSSRLWVLFIPWLSQTRLNTTRPRDQDVVVNISPAREALSTDLYGRTELVQADPSGNLALRATRSPRFITVPARRRP